MTTRDAQPQPVLLVIDPAARATAGVVVANSGIEGAALLRDPRYAFSGIFVHHRAWPLASFPLIRQAHLSQVGVPIFVMLEPADQAIPSDVLRRAGVQGVVRKPIAPLELARLATPEPAPETGRAASETAFSELDGAFIPVSARHFACGQRSAFDLYVRLNAGKYVKLLDAGDTFPRERVLRFVEKGLNRFYISREDQAAYLAVCDAMSEAILRDQRASATLRTGQALNFGDQALHFLEMNGVNADSIVFAKKFADRLQDSVRRHDWSAMPGLDLLLRDFGALEHGTAVAMVTTLILRAMGFESPKILSQMGLAALLHDVGIKQVLPHWQGNDPAELSPEDLEKYHQHPLVSAQLLDGLPGIGSSVRQAIEQHHERRDGRGFPHRARAGQIHKLAEVLGLADAFVDLVAAALKNPALDIGYELEKRVFNGFSASVIVAFRSLFGQASKPNGLPFWPAA